MRLFSKKTPRNKAPKRKLFSRVVAGILVAGTIGVVLLSGCGNPSDNFSNYKSDSQRIHDISSPDITTPEHPDVKDSTSFDEKEELNPKDTKDSVPSLDRTPETNDSGADIKQDLETETDTPKDIEEELLDLNTPDEVNKPELIEDEKTPDNQEPDIVPDLEEISEELDCPELEQDIEPLLETAVVTEVIDGDTLTLENGDKVRLIGINTSEQGKLCYDEATDALIELVLNQTVTLESDVVGIDMYGRLLRYVYVDDLFVNLNLVELGFAHAYPYGSNLKYADEFDQADLEAHETGGCLWTPSDEFGCVEVEEAHPDAEGKDKDNLTDEYITFENVCNYSFNMEDWLLKDLGTHMYVFPEFTFQSSSTVSVLTGICEDSEDELCMNKSSPIWNNTGDRVLLWDSEGYFVLDYSY